MTRHKINLNRTEITSRNNEKLLDVFIGKTLSFDFRIKHGKISSALARISSYLIVDQKFLRISSVVKSQFSCPPLIWMFWSRSLNNSLNHIHERALMFLYEDHVHSL